VATVLKLAGFGLVTLVWLIMLTAMAPGNTVPTSRLLDFTTPITANDLKPAECSGIILTVKVIGSGTINGTGANDLIVGGPGADTIDAKGANDCILGGAGNDSIDGSGGTDVCIGGPGTNTFNRCETTY